MTLSTVDKLGANTVGLTWHIQHKTTVLIRGNALNVYRYM